MPLPAASAFTDAAVTEAQFKTAMTDLVNYLTALETTPVGTVAAFAMSTAPTGFLKANGAAISRTTYSALFAKIGTTFGAGDGATTFNLPDLRGYFLRAWDDGRGVDAGRAFGSAQADQNLWHGHTGSVAAAGAHTHDIKVLNADGGGTSEILINGLGKTTTTVPAKALSAGSHAHGLTVDGAGGGEARPKNIALLFCIKY